jgi:hypothetical protein
MADNVRIPLSQLFHTPTAAERKWAAWGKLLDANQARERTRMALMAAANVPPQEPDKNDPLTLLPIDDATREKIRKKLRNGGCIGYTASNWSRRPVRMVAEDTTARVRRALGLDPGIGIARPSSD